MKVAVNYLKKAHDCMEIPPPYTCLFCKSTTTSFFSVEHILPESLGNKEKILPKGLVCDKCNNGILSTLDQCLVELDLIKFMRTHHGIESKAGKVPESRFGNMHMKNPSKNHVIVKLDNINTQLKKNADNFTISWRGSKPMNEKNLKLLARSLYKVGLEFICLDCGSDFALSSRFDETRDIVLKRQDFNGYLFIGTNKESVSSGVGYKFVLDKDEKLFAFFEFNYMFLKIMFDMEKRVTLLDDEAKVMGMTVLKF